MQNTNDFINSKNTKRFRRQALKLQAIQETVPYNDNNKFFTVELKVTKGNAIKFSPHQIAFHVTHPHNTFILVKSLKETTYKTFSCARILTLAACGLMLSSLGA